MALGCLRGISIRSDRKQCMSKFSGHMGTDIMARTEGV